MADGQNSGGGWGWFWLVVVIAVVGGGYLYQREGGKIFGPDGLAGKGAGAVKQKRTVYSFQAERNEGVFSHDLSYEYTGSEKLEDVDLTITIWYDRGAKPEIKRFWNAWMPNEKKTINITASDGVPQKHKLSGKARIGFDEVLIDAEFSKKAPGEK